MFGFDNDELKEIIAVLSEFRDIDKAVIFGSRAKGNYSNGSDADIAISGENLKDDTALSVSSFLNEETNLPYRFDVINFNKIENYDLKEHIKRVGKLIYQRR